MAKSVCDGLSLPTIGGIDRHVRQQFASVRFLVCLLLRRESKCLVATQFNVFMELLILAGR
jgi:hypothetical protein